MNNQRVILTNNALWAVYDGLTSLYLSAFALALGADNLTIGILGALPFLASILAQIPGAELVQHYPRKSVYVFFSLIGRSFWLPLLLSPFLFAKPLLAVIAFFLLARIFESMTEPAFTTIIADAVPEKNRGEYTSKRLRIIGFFGITSMTLGGIFLKQFPKESPNGFAIMFALGILLGILATLRMRKIQETEYPDHEHHHIKEFFTLTRALKSFVRFSVMFNFAFMLASPFFAVYMLKTLNISYEYYGIASSISIFAQLLTSGYIGRLSDKFGDKPIAILGILGTSLVPLFFLTITQDRLWLLIPVQLFSGIVWAAADITRFNLLLDLTDPKKRAIQVAEYSLFANVPLIIAPIVGGWMSESVTVVLAGIPLIFVTSSILRAFSAFFLIPIKEPRSKQEYSAAYVLQEAVHFHPNKGIVNGIHVVKRVVTNIIK